MRRTAQGDAVAVTRTGAQSITSLTRLDAIREAFLQVRRVYLHARRARNARVDCFRRDLACGKVRALENLFDLSAADLADGAPLSAVLRPWESVIVELTELARERDERTAREPFSLLPLHQRETRAEAALNEAQNAALAREDDPEALQSVDEQITRYRVTLDDLGAAIKRKLARLTSAPKVWA